MSTSITELIDSFYEAFCGNTELLDAVLTDDWDDIPLGPGQEPGRAGARHLIEGLNKAFSDFRTVVEEIIDARGEEENGMVGVPRQDPRRPHRRVLRHRADRSRRPRYGRTTSTRSWIGRIESAPITWRTWLTPVPAGSVLAIQLNTSARSVPEDVLATTHRDARLMLDV